MTKEEIIVKIKMEIPLTKAEERFYFVDVMGGSIQEFERIWAITHNNDPGLLID